jgi:hypothetical protein
MKLLTTTFTVACAICLCGCDKGGSNAYERLKSETGASDEELDEGIKFYTKFCVLLHDEIEAGTVNVEDLIESAKDAKEAIAAVQREDEMTAVMTLAYLRTLEKKGSERAGEKMAKQLAQFVEARFPTTDNSQKIREKILEYAKTSPALTALTQQSEQDL